MNPNNLSFKDSSARVVQENGLFYRYIFHEYRAEYDHLMHSGLYKALINKGYIIEHEEKSVCMSQDGRFYKKILPKQITFHSYPYEWSFRQWKKVILTYLSINEIALKFGMILKDATPFNFYIDSYNAILFDTTSFVFFNKNNKWIAYKHFCEMLLSPITLIYYKGNCWGNIYKSFLHGIPLKFVSKQLPKRSWFNLTILIHIHLHAKFIQHPSDEANTRVLERGFSVEKLNFLFLSIKNSINSMRNFYLFKSQWTEYYENDIETEVYLIEKEEVIRHWLSLTRPKSVLDLGANTGRFSIISSDYAEKVIALEADENCVNILDEIITLKKNRKIYPLVGELSAPNPGFGLLNKEFLPFIQRAKSEMVLSLALIHHLFFTRDMSFDLIAELFSEFSTKYLIVEFIAKEDRKVKKLLSVKPKKSKEYNFDFFKTSLFKHFQLIEIKQFETSSRCLMLLKKINDEDDKY